MEFEYESSIEQDAQHHIEHFTTTESGGDQHVPADILKSDHFELPPEDHSVENSFKVVPAMSEDHKEDSEGIDLEKQDSKHSHISDDIGDMNIEIVTDSEEFWDDGGFYPPPSQSTPVRGQENKNLNADKGLSKNYPSGRDLSRTQDNSFNNSSLFDELSVATGSKSIRTSVASLNDSEADSTLHHSGVSRMSSHLSMDYDYEWEAQKALKEIAENNEELPSDARDRIILRELSFEEGGKVAGPELYAPVFLAVTEDNDDEELANMRKTHKTQSLEDLLEVIDDEEKVAPKRKSKTPPPRLHRTKVLTPPLEEPDEFPPVDDNDISGEDSVMDDQAAGTVSSNSEEQSSETSQVKQIPFSPSTSKPFVAKLKSHSQPKRQARKLPEIPVDIKKKNEKKISTDSLSDEDTESRVGRWYTVVVNTRNKILDLDKIEPYMKVLSHGGYCNEGRSVIVTFMACYLPGRHIKEYEYIMEQLFFYVVSTVDLLATREDYVLVYFNGGARNSAPGLNWLRKYYTQIDRSLKKSLDSFYIVHPDLWLKTMVRLFKPFISSSFTQRLHFVKTVRDLSQLIPTEYIFIPDEVMSSDPDYLRYHGK